MSVKTLEFVPLHQSRCLEYIADRVSMLLVTKNIMKHSGAHLRTTYTQYLIDQQQTLTEQMGVQGSHRVIEKRSCWLWS